MEEGHSFYESLSRRRGVFPRLYLKMVDIGERNGNLSQMLRHLHDHFQRMAKFREKIVDLLDYPCISFIVMLGILLVIIRFVLPTLREMFAYEEIELPISTSYLMAAGNWLTINGYLLFLGLIALLFVLGIIHLLANKIPLVRLLLDRLYISLPVIGPLTKEMGLVRFSHILGTLLESGVPLDEALETTGEVPIRAEKGTVLFAEKGSLQLILQRKGDGSILSSLAVLSVSGYYKLCKKNRTVPFQTPFKQIHRFLSLRQSV